VYSNADILLLDDVLAALDVHTSAWIVDKCLRGDLITGRTVILATHNVALTAPLASFVVTLNTAGRIKSAGPIEETFLHESQFRQPVAVEENTPSGEQDDSGFRARAPTDGQLIAAEETGIGRMDKQTRESLYVLMSSHFIDNILSRTSLPQWYEWALACIFLGQPYSRSPSLGVG
jgi:ABC-type glutathione transport system ATPase component